MTYLIAQPFGLGDIIFTQQLISDITNFKHDIVWPVEPHLISGLNIAYPHIHWTDVTKTEKIYINTMRHCHINGYKIIPIRFANTILKVPYKMCMRAKYDLYNIDWKTWRNFTFKRNENSENKLIEHLKIDISSPYHLINKRFRTNESGNINIPNDPSMPVIEMEHIKGFSMFDWSKIIENAQRISTVGTSLNYLIELLELKTPYVTLYKRLPDETHYKNYDYILTKHKYIFT